MKKRYPVIDIEGTGQNIKHIMQMRRMTVKDIQAFLELSTPQSIYHWFDGRNLPTLDNLYALSELFCIPVDALIKGNREFEYRQIESATYRRVMIYYEKIVRLREGYTAGTMT